MPYKITLKVEGLDEMIRRNSPEQVSNMKKDLSIMEVEEVQVAVVGARNIAPVKTGNMQSKIDIVDIDPENLEIEAGVQGVFYAPFVEFGTSKMRARPFWRPAIWAAFFRIRERANEIVNRYAGKR